MGSPQRTSGLGCARNPGDYMSNDPASACPCLYLHTQQQSSGCQCQGALRTQVYAVIYQRPQKQNKTKPGQRENNNLSNSN